MKNKINLFIKFICCCCFGVLAITACAPTTLNEPRALSFSSDPFYFNQNKNKPKNRQYMLEQRATLFSDTDKDGVRDQFDDDIDNDQVPNLLDVSPFDNKDKSKLNHRVLIINSQKIYLVLNSFTLSEDWLNFITNQLQQIFKYQPKVKNILHTIALWDWNSSTDNLNGNYDKAWKVIRIKAPEQFNEPINYIKSVFIHELFHIVAHAEPTFYNKMITHLGWTTNKKKSLVFVCENEIWNVNDWQVQKKITNNSVMPSCVPSRRSLLAPEEFFAEVMTMIYLYKNKPTLLNIKYFENFEKFQESATFKKALSLNKGIPY